MRRTGMGNVKVTLPGVIWDENQSDVITSISEHEQLTHLILSRQSENQKF